MFGSFGVGSDQNLQKIDGDAETRFKKC